MMADRGRGRPSVRRAAVCLAAYLLGAGCGGNSPTGPGESDLDIFINEFLASNATGMIDPDFGEQGDWIELYNGGAAEVDLTGFHMTDDLSNRRVWEFPPGATIEADGFLIVWADGKNLVAEAIHTGFKLSSAGEAIGLYDGNLARVDEVSFGVQSTDVSTGRSADGGSAFIAFDRPTPGTSNLLAPPEGPGGVRINEFLASNDSANTDPDFGRHGDWIELYNTGDSAVALGGWTITDDLGDPARWTIPGGISIAPSGFLVVWADGRDTVAAALHASFRLSRSGEEIGLFTPSSAMVDTVVFGGQAADISAARVPDGTGAWRSLDPPTPGETNGAAKGARTATRSAVVIGGRVR